MTQTDMIHYPNTQATAGFDGAAPPQAARHAGAMARVSTVLASWRDTERELSQLPESSPDRSRLRAAVERLRVTYQQSFTELRDDSAEF